MMINFTQYKFSGFSLIELLTTIGILGILMTVAIPSYRNYSARSQVTESLNFLSGYKNKVSTYYNENGAFPGSDVDYDAPSYLDYIRWVAADNSLQASFSNAEDGYASLAGGILLLRPTIDDVGTINWTCESSSSSQLRCDFLPSNCHTNCAAD